MTLGVGAAYRQNRAAALRSRRLIVGNPALSVRKKVLPTVRTSDLPRRLVRTESKARAMVGSMGKERLLEMLLAGAPERVTTALAALSPEDARALAELRQTLVALAMSAPEPTPSPALRARLLARRPRPQRPRTPVLVVLDMIQDYLRPGGALEVPRARDIVPALRARLAGARAAGVPVIYVCDSHSPDDPDFREWPMHAVEGTPGADPWPEIAPEAGEPVIRKRTYSAFAGSDLADLLDRLGADEIVLTGCATELGITATAIDALQRGFVVTVPEDCQAGSSPATEMASLAAISVMPPFEPRYLRSANGAT
jgi:nicotinamidase-related amidase